MSILNNSFKGGPVIVHLIWNVFYIQEAVYFNIKYWPGFHIPYPGFIPRYTLDFLSLYYMVIKDLSQWS